VGDVRLEYDWRTGGATAVRPGDVIGAAGGASRGDRQDSRAGGFGWPDRRAQDRSDRSYQQPDSYLHTASRASRPFRGPVQNGDIAMAGVGAALVPGGRPGQRSGDSQRESLQSGPRTTSPDWRTRESVGQPGERESWSCRDGSSGPRRSHQHETPASYLGRSAFAT